MEQSNPYFKQELQKIFKQNNEYEELTQIIYHHSNDLILFLDTLGRIISVNKAGLDFSGFNREEVLGVMFWKLPGVFTISRTGEYLNVFKNTLLGRTRHHFINTLIDKNNREHTMDFSAIPLTKNGKVQFILVIAKDITKEQEIEQAYHRTAIVKSNLQNIIDSSPQLILALDKNSTVSLWNKTLEHLTGYSQKEIIGKSIKNAVFLEKPHQFIEFIKNVKKGNEEQRDNIVLRCKNNSEKIVSFICSPILGNHESSEGVVCIGHDTSIHNDTMNKLLRGISYIDFSSNNKEMMQLFLNIAFTGYHALLISRGEHKAIEKYKSFIHIVECSFGTHSANNKHMICSSDELYEHIHKFITKHEKNIVFLDRIDYILVHESFEKVLQMIYKIQDIISKKGSILLLRVNPELLTLQQQELFLEELEPLPAHSLKDLYVDDVSIKILQYIKKQETVKKHNSMKEISQHLDISKMTVSKRISSLEELMLIQIQKQGRKKIVILTDKGHELLSNVENMKK